MVGAEPPLERRIGREDLNPTRIWDDGRDAPKSSTPYFVLGAAVRRSLPPALEPFLRKPTVRTLAANSACTRGNN